MEDDKKPADFFSIIEKEAVEERIENPFDDDEIIFKDESGNIRVIKGGQTEATEQPVATPVLKVKTAPKVQVQPAKPFSVDKNIQEVIKKSGIHFNDSELEKRFKNIQGNSPTKLKLLNKIRGTLADEWQMHIKYAQYKLHHEWFTEEVLADATTNPR